MLSPFLLRMLLESLRSFKNLIAGIQYIEVLNNRISTMTIDFKMDQSVKSPIHSVDLRLISTIAELI